MSTAKDKNAIPCSRLESMTKGITFHRHEENCEISFGYVWERWINKGEWITLYNIDLLSVFELFYEHTDKGLYFRLYKPHRNIKSLSLPLSYQSSSLDFVMFVEFRVNQRMNIQPSVCDMMGKYYCKIIASMFVLS